MKNKKVTNLVTTSMMASALIFSYGGSAFANENTTGTALTDATTETVQVVNAEVVSDGTTTEVTQEAAAALVPGDFFYFVKSFLENIRLAVTLDEYKEAELLSEFATERIAEANALIAEGKTEEAAKLLQEAISTQETASEVLNQTEEESTEATQETTQEPAEETSATTEDTVQVDEPAEDEDVTAVESKLGNNIDALLAAVQKIDNPRAQAALMKNIEKSFAKLSKKIQKLEKKHGIEETTTEEVANVEGTNNTNTAEEATVENNVEAEETVTTEDQELAEAPVKPVKTEIVNKESVKAKVEAKQQQVQVKVEEKKQAAKAKAEAKKNENAKKDKE